MNIYIYKSGPFGGLLELMKSNSRIPFLGMVESMVTVKGVLKFSVSLRKHDQFPF
jgi:hypothetical protein